MAEEVAPEAVDLMDGLPRVVILDFGSQFSHLIARRIREMNVFCELHSCEISEEALRALSPVGIILSGGPSSVFGEDSPHAPSCVFDLGVPVLGICYGLQEMMHVLEGGRVESSDSGGEYGMATVALSGASSPLLEGLEALDKLDVWMSHGDKVVSIPDDFTAIGGTASCTFAMVECVERQLFGLQFHPEVTHSKQGKTLLANFVMKVCKAEATWTMDGFVDRMIAKIREQVGEEDEVIGAVSGGVDSTVAAVLLSRAIGDRFHAVLVDNGLLRAGEAEQVVSTLREGAGINLHVVDASDRFLTELAGVEDPEKKRKIIGHTFIHVFQDKAVTLGDNVNFLLQGTLYPDVIESVSYKGPSVTIKSHHNVGALLPGMHLKLVEPLRELFKDEVRELGAALGLPASLTGRHPFPGPGLAIRVLGDITRERLDTLRAADVIWLEEIRKAGVYDDISQAFATLLAGVRTVGVMGDSRTYDAVVALRAVTTTDFMTADWYRASYDLLAIASNRIINEVPGVNRVVYDISSKPPATIEWE
eukprot:PLAT6551.1.p1 GENE.PLAT6551.1~~PLAT6551.1.p1  ORF type:complete len:554 (+),score=268.93 PLAT6551.1:62-1663(+)